MFGKIIAGAVATEDRACGGATRMRLQLAKHVQGVERGAEHVVQLRRDDHIARPYTSSRAAPSARSLTRLPSR